MIPMGETGREKLPPNIKIRNDFKPGDIGYLIYLHGTLYANEYGWDHTFEAYVAGPLAEFAKSRNDREKIWIIEKDERVGGSIAIVEASKEQAQLRWLLLDPDLRGCGIGRMLVAEAIDFCREKNYRSVFLWTVNRLTSAAHLYEAFGFEVTEESTRELWGSLLTEQRYDLVLRA